MRAALNNALQLRVYPVLRTTFLRTAAASAAGSRLRFPVGAALDGAAFDGAAGSVRCAELSCVEGCTTVKNDARLERVSA